MASPRRRSQPISKPNIKARLRAYGRDHVRGLIFSLGKLYRQPFATTLTVLMIAIALALPACLLVLLNNLQQVTTQWDDAGQISIFLQTKIKNSEVKKLQQQLAKNQLIESVRFISAEKALQDFQANSDLGNLLEGLTHNPLPPTLVLTPTSVAKNSDAMHTLVQELHTLAHVESVQLDMQWLQRLQTITKILRRIIITLGVLLALSVLLVVGNSVRSDIENRREEIEVTKLIGATDRFIRRPFLYGGIWYGLFGGVLALLLVLTVLLVIKAPTQLLVGLYNSTFSLIFPSFAQCLGLVVLSISLGLLGSAIAVSRHIAKIEPS